MKTWTQIGITTVEYKGEEYEIIVKGTFSESMEDQDADGNRGRLTTFLDDIKIISITPPLFPGETLHSVEQEVYDLNKDDFDWENESPSEPDHEDLDLDESTPWEDEDEPRSKK